ncbi:MAG: hypothetical protein AB7F98_06215 [Novosphingobium sp.]
MTIRFAASKTSGSTVISRILSSGIPHGAVNDNGDPVCSDLLLKAALRHFAEYGLSAAERARENAEAAFFAGSREDYQWWLSICSALDRRMAAAVAFRNARSHG